MPSRVEPFPYYNRELNWLAFNRRVLAEAENPDNPPLERMKFLSITASNLDEFMMVRFASLRARMLAGDETTDMAGYTPKEQVRLIAEDVHAFMDEQIKVLSGHVLPTLRSAGLRFLSAKDWNREQARWVEGCCKRDILPRITVQVTDSKHPFPQAPGRTLQLCLMILDKKGLPSLCSVRLPPEFPRVWRIPLALGGGFVLLEEMIGASVARCVPERRVLGCWPFRVTRDADFTVTDDEPENLLAKTKESLRRRKTGAVVRLEIDAGAPEEVQIRLRSIFSIQKEYVYLIDGPLHLTFLLKELYKESGMEALRYPPFQGKMPAQIAHAGSVLDVLRKEDVFLHHPYDSFDAVLCFVREAAADPRVLAINQTLYRVSGNSPVIKALCEAAEAGKRVTVLLEVKARFDEENNIRWGEVLERAGCTVIYGLPRLKTHSKITLIVRREGEGLRRYMHLGTGNYNDVTAKQYTDMGLLTSDEALGEDAQAFFNMITGFSREPEMRKLIYAPRTLRPTLESLIRAEEENARHGKPSGIIAKMNSLVDQDIIRLLYDAGAAGVSIRLIVRGMCCLAAGVPGISHNIEVRSLIGRFLEHSRVFRFENGGDPRIFLSSADWMPRNLNRRVELMFPVEDLAVRSRVEQVLNLQWCDTAKAWRMEADGSYRRLLPDALPINAQEALFQASE